MGKRKDGHSSNQTMASSSSFAALAKASTAWLHRKGMLEKEIITKLSLIHEISSKVHATSNEQILSEFNNSTSLAKLHSTSTLEKLMLWQKSKAFLITKATVHSWFSFLSTRSHRAASTSPLFVSDNQAKTHWCKLLGLGNSHINFVN